MKHTQHTPGPWIVCVQDDGLERANTIFAESQLENGIIDSSEWDYCIAEAGIGHENYEANARLIAAAPSMYSLLAMMAKNGDNAARQLIESIGNEKV